jgi:Ni/Fe-hydrogenase subunit HybB-like protein
MGELLITEELELLFAGNKYSFLFWGELLVGVILPMVMFSIKKVRLSRGWTLAGALLVAAGIAFNRFNASWFAIEPIGDVRYFPSWMEVAILVGVFSGVLLVYTLIAHYFPVFAETIQDDIASRSSRKARLERVSTTIGD